MEIAWLGTLSPVGALVVIIMLIALGKLIPERTHDKIVALKDDQIRVQEKITGKLLTQSDQSLENDQTMLHLLRSLPTSEPPEGDST